MSILPIVVRVEQFADFSQANLGDRALDLAWLRQFVSVPPTLLIPADTFDKVLISTHSVLKLQQLIDDDQMSPTSKQKKISEFFTKLLLPQSFITHIHAEYHEYFSSQTVRVFSASSSASSTISEVRGEVNLLIAIKNVWGELLLNSIKQSKKRPQLVSTNILIQAIPITKVVGFVASHHLGGMHKAALVIQAQAGAGKKVGDIETYQVDVRSQAIIVRPDIQPQPRNNKKIELSLLSDAECRQLAALSIPIIRQRLRPMVIHWSLTQAGFVFYDLLQPSQTNTSYPAARTQPTSATKVYVASNSIARMSASIPLVDGVGPISARYLVHTSGLHPIGALRNTASQTVLKHNIRRALFELVSVKRDLTILYSLYTATPTQRAKLFLSESERTAETETAMLSGASFLLTFPQWLDFELQTLVEFLKQTPVHLDLVLPEIKTPTEIPLLLKHIQKSGLQKMPNVKIWLEVATPAIAQSLHLFPLDNISGILINLNELLPRLLCVDPAMIRVKKESTQQLATAVIQDLLSGVSKQLLQSFHTQQISVMVLSQIIEPIVVKKIVSLGWQGICVQPSQILETRSYIQNAEKLVIEHKL
jgi:hypothetical protein